MATDTSIVRPPGEETQDAINSVSSPIIFLPNVTVNRSRTRSGPTILLKTIIAFRTIGSINVGIGTTIFLVSIIKLMQNKKLWHAILGGVVSSLLTIPLGILCLFLSSVAKSPSIYMATETAISTCKYLAMVTVVAAAGSITMCAIHFDESDNIFLFMFLTTESVNFLVNIVTAVLCSQYFWSDTTSLAAFCPCFESNPHYRLSMTDTSEYI